MIAAQVKAFINRHAPGLFSVARTALKAPYLRYCFNRPQGSLVAPGAFTGPPSGALNDAALIERLIASYASRKEAPSGQWSDIFLERHRDVDEAMRSDNRARITEILRNPVSSDLFYGFDSTARSLRQGGLRIEDRRAPALTLDALVTLAEALGARRLDYPENYYVGRLAKLGVEEVLEQIDRQLGTTLSYPNPYPSEYGLRSKRGIISYRAPQAVYQAWRAAQLSRGTASPRILEIGGGLGRTAYYAWQLGLRDYTIVDIPVSSLAQGYFLGQTLGAQNLALPGETDQSKGIKLISPETFLKGEQRYDLVVNVDSLTEIGEAAATDYWRAIEKRASIFLSINHEANEFTVAQLLRDRVVSRTPYWLRRGYVEEVVRLEAPR